MKQELGNLFFHLMRDLMQSHTAMWQKYLPDLTKLQYSVLCVAEKNPGIEQHDLTKVVLSTKATLAELLVRMEGKDLIKRQQGISDRRRKFIFITPKGQIALNNAKKIVKQVDDFFLSRLNDQQKKEAVMLLKTMIEHSEII
ncbi:MarR family winged helix-turn-helix transcriptional regulator [Morganella morganii]|nr:MarR family transcriptional regulator [Morganella morganii]